jgi:hypothetical protein
MYQHKGSAMRAFFIFFAIFCFSFAVTPVAAQDAAPAIEEVTPTVTPIEEFTRGAPAGNQGGVRVLTPQAETPQKPKDACEAYTGNMSAYNSCNDRMNKIDRMKQARERRAAPPVTKAAPPTPEAPQAQAAPPAPKAESGKK